MAWGYHLSLDCVGCLKHRIKDADNIADFTKALVKRIDMTAYGEPQIVHFGEDDKAGYTLIQLIETSNICAHFCDDTGNAYIDVFSCKIYKPDDVVSTVKEFFKPTNIRLSFSTRGD